MAVRILDEHLINKIAAGEVVERPASVVKELVENALDAGATRLRVELRAGGRNLVRVEDDGGGMSHADALLCLERHATSKILSENDLFRVHTLGFRGEAIPSIASVSKFTLVTRQAQDEAGTRVVVDGGKVVAVEPAGCPAGTEVSAASLFFNTPARRKFLRSVETELGHCLEAVTREVLLRPELDVEVLHDERTVIRCPRVDRRARRAADLLGPHAEALVPASFTRGTLEVEALLSPVGVHRGSAQGSTWLYVNGRFVKDLVLRRAVSAAYAGIVPKDRWPLVLVDVRVPTEDVDVNVHPAKTEVRFAHAYELQNAITEGLRAALREHGIRRPVAVEPRYVPPPAPSPRQVGLDLEDARQPRLMPVVHDDAGLGRPPRPVAPPRAEADAVPLVGAAPVREMGAPFPAPPPPPSLRVVEGEGTGGAPAPRALELARPEGTPARVTLPTGSPAPADAAPLDFGAHPPPPNALLPVARFRDLRVIGQLADTYVLCEGAGELVVIDQHAAHERVTLDRLSRDPATALGPSQRLLVPALVELPAGRARLLAAQVDLVAAYGLELSPLGGGTFAVQAVPAALRDVDLAELLADVADEIAEGGGAAAAEARLEKALATMACHGSVRAGQELDEREMRALLVALDAVDFSVCAHGRPVAIRIAPGELEKRFHRT